MKPRILVLLIIISLILVFTGVLIEMPSSSPYSIYNTGYNGYSFLAKKYSIKPLLNITSTDIAEPNNTIILVPLLHDLDDETLSELKRFIEGGGAIVFLDEKGYMNEFMYSYLNVPISIANATVYDDIMNYNGNRSLVLIETVFGNENLACYLYRPSPIEIGKGSSDIEIIVHGVSSPFSYRDNDGNGYFSLGDVFGEQPIIVEVKISNGNIYVVPDLDVFTNMLIRLGDNEKLASFLVGNYKARYIYLGGTDATFFEYVKTYLSGFNESDKCLVRITVELLVLMILALVVYHGEKTGLWR